MSLKGKKNFFVPYLIIVSIILPVAVFSACPTDTGTGEVPERPIPSTVKMTAHPCRTGCNLDPVRVVHTVWYEPEEDPRQVIGYELEDGTPYFDHIVMLYGLRLRHLDCNTTGWRDQCRLTGLHVCLTGNMLHYRNNWEEYFKPIRDRGIKAILSIVPAGLNSYQRHQGDAVALHMVYRWPREEEALFRWADIGGRPYPYNEEASNRLVQQVAELFNELNVDGVGYDEEYGGTMAIVRNGVADSISPRGALSGHNLLRFAYELDKAAGRKLIQEFYEIEVSLPWETTFISSSGEQVRAIRDDIICYSFHAFYGGFAQNSSLPNRPRDQYGPASVAIADTQGGAPKPRPGRDGGSGVIPRMESVLRGGYGVVMYYCLRSRTDLEEGDPWGRLPWPPTMFGTSRRPEEYFSQISEILHGQRTLFNGLDFRRRFRYQ